MAESRPKRDPGCVPVLAPSSDGIDFCGNRGDGAGPSRPATEILQSCDIPLTTPAKVSPNITVAGQTYRRSHLRRILGPPPAL